jgi:hypothetical protein
VISVVSQPTGGGVGNCPTAITVVTAGNCSIALTVVSLPAIGGVGNCSVVMKVVLLPASGEAEIVV